MRRDARRRTPDAGAGSGSFYRQPPLTTDPKETGARLEQAPVGSFCQLPMLTPCMRTCPIADTSKPVVPGLTADRK